MIAVSKTRSNPNCPEAPPLLESLLLSVIKDEKGAFEKLHAELRQYVLNVAYRYCQYYPAASEMIKDVSQEVWRKVYEKRDTIENPDCFKTWLYKTTKHISLNLVKKEKRRTSNCRIGTDGRIELSRDVFRELAAPAKPTSFMDLKELDRKSLSAALNKLSPNHREALTMAYLENMSASEISERVGISQGTVRSRIHYAINYLKSYLT